MSSSIKLEFDEKTHTYIKNGIILKSVTQILQELFPLKYDNVPKEVLQNKANYGTELHKFIEIIEKKKPKKPLAYIKRYYKPNIYQEESLKEYLRLKKEYNIEVLESEKRVVYKNYYAGTLDIKGLVNNESAIIDVKTTYELDDVYVSFQDSLYEMADEPVKKLYCLWLPKGHRGKLVEVKRINKKVLKKLIGEKKIHGTF